MPSARAHRHFFDEKTNVRLESQREKSGNAADAIRERQQEMRKNKSSTALRTNKTNSSGTPYWRERERQIDRESADIDTRRAEQSSQNYATSAKRERNSVAHATCSSNSGRYRTSSRTTQSTLRSSRARSSAVFPRCAHHRVVIVDGGETRAAQDTQSSHLVPHGHVRARCQQHADTVGISVESSPHRCGYLVLSSGTSDFPPQHTTRAHHLTTDKRTHPPASKSVSQPTSQPASQPANQPASQSASQPASQSASQPAS
jgi:hypothetical protein